MAGAIKTGEGTQAQVSAVMSRTFDDQLSSSLQIGDIGEMRRIHRHLSSHPCPRSYDDVLLLMDAIKSKRMTVVRYLIQEHGVDPNSARWVGMEAIGQPPQYVTPLGVAAAYGFHGIVQYLAEHGADLEKPNEYGESPLHVACREGHLSVVQYLTDHHHVDLETVNASLCTPLLSASVSGHLEVVKCLLTAGADANRRTIGLESSVLHGSSISGNVDLLKWLIANEVPPTANRYGILPIFDAATRGQENALQFWLDYYDRSDEKNSIIACNAVTLMGTYACFRYGDKEKAFHYFKWAQRLRKEHNLPSDTFSPLPAVPVYSNIVEAIDEDGLEVLRQSGTAIEMMGHCLMVCERILGPLHGCLAVLCMRYSYNLLQADRSDEIMPLWLHLIDRQMAIFQSSGHPSLINSTFALVVCSLSLSQRARDINPLLALERLVDIVKNLSPSHQQKGYVGKIGLHLLCLTVKHAKSSPSSVDCSQLINLVKQFLTAASVSPTGETPLHSAVTSHTTILQKDHRTVGKMLNHFPCFETARCLLAAGASVNAFDQQKNTPLHSVVVSPCGTLEAKMGIVKLLLESGAYCPARNCNKATALFLCRSNSALFQLLESRTLTINLQKLAACAIIDYNLPYRESLPPKLVEFVDLH